MLQWSIFTAGLRQIEAWVPLLQCLRLDIPLLEQQNRNYKVLKITMHAAAGANSGQKDTKRDFPGGPVVQNPPASTGAQVQSRVWEDPTCLRTTKSLHHNYRTCTLEPGTAATEVRGPWSPGSETREAATVRSLCTATREESLLSASRESWGAAKKTQPSQNSKELKKVYKETKKPNCHFWEQRQRLGAKEGYCASPCTQHHLKVKQSESC